MLQGYRAIGLIDIEGVRDTPNCGNPCPISWKQYKHGSRAAAQTDMEDIRLVERTILPLMQGPIALEWYNILYRGGYGALWR